MRQCNSSVYLFLSHIEYDATCVTKAWVKKQELTRKTSENFGAGKRCVDEKADVGVGYQLSNEPRNEQAVVVVDPDEITRLVQLSDALGVSLVSPKVCLPVSVFDGQLGCDVLPKKIVEQGPESLLAITFVVIVRSGIV